MDRSIAPEIQAPTELNITIPKEYDLNNGIQIFWIDDVKDEGVKVELTWEAGTKYQSKSLVASFTNRLLLSGTKEKSANDLTNEIDFLGGYYQNGIDKDHSTVTLYGLNENITEIVDKFKEGFTQADFPDSQLIKESEIGLERYKVESEKVNVLCHRRFNQSIFGPDCKYGSVADEADFLKLTKEDVVDFYNHFYIDAKPVIFIVGKYNDSLLNALKDLSLIFTGKPQVKPDIGATQLKGEMHEAKNGAIQSAIRVGRLLVDKKHPDYFGFQVLNTILGGYFGSRLMANIREDKGYTYGIGSGVAVLEQSSYFFISTEVGSEVRVDTINEIYKELEKLTSIEVSSDELTKVKNYLLGDFLRQSDGPFAMMECFKNIYFNGLAISYYSDFIQAVNNVTPLDLTRIAQLYLQKEDLLVLSVG